MAFLLSGVTIYFRFMFYIFHLNDLESAIFPGSPGSCLVGTDQWKLQSEHKRYSLLCSFVPGSSHWAELGYIPIHTLKNMS